MWFHRCACGCPSGECPQLLGELQWGLHWTERSEIPRWGGWSPSSRPFFGVSWLMKVCDFHRKFVPYCSFWVLLRCSCQVEFCSFSIEKIGNYYFTVSTAENGSSRVSTFYILRSSDGCHSGRPSACQQRCLAPSQWRLSTVSSQGIGFFNKADAALGGKRAEKQFDYLRILDHLFIWLKKSYWILVATLVLF